MNAPTAAEHSSGGAPHDPYAALRLRDFRLFLGGSLVANIGLQMQTIAVGWEIASRTEDERMLGYVGLVQVLPVVLLAIVAGHVADRFSRRRVVVASISVVALASTLLTLVAAADAPLGALYACLLMSATGRAFHQPAKSSLLPQLVPRETFSNAVTWSMSGFQLSSVVGPALGGILIAVCGAPTVVFALAALASLCYVVMMLLIGEVPAARSTSEISLDSLLVGFRFVVGRPVMLAALALDLFAVLLGGATTLMPIFAKKILDVGPTGYGWLETAPAVGALSMAVLMAHRPPLRHAGHALLGAVTGFGLATIVFGLSQNFWLSWGMLLLTGACDNVSVVVRHTLVQMLTPDAMRGRVSAVNSMFIGASNELGGFESGEVAYYFGPVASVVSGGLGTLVVVGCVALFCPALRRYGRLDAGLQGPQPGPDVAPRAADRPGVTPLSPLPGDDEDVPGEAAP